MGEMADFYNEQIEENEYQRDLWRMGFMSFDEATERGVIDEYGNDGEEGRRVSSYKTCRACKKHPLWWGFSKKYHRWLLYDLNGNLHKCKKKPLE